MKTCRSESTSPEGDRDAFDALLQPVSIGGERDTELRRHLFLLVHRFGVGVPDGVTELAIARVQRKQFERVGEPRPQCLRVERRAAQREEVRQRTVAQRVVVVEITQCLAYGLDQSAWITGVRFIAAV